MCKNTLYVCNYKSNYLTLTKNYFSSHYSYAICKHEWGTAASTFVYFTQLLPSGGAFLAEMAGKLNWLEW